MSYTKEPWFSDDSESTAISAICGDVKFWIADFAGNPGLGDESGSDNRSRAVLCVNACAGIEDPANYIPSVIRANKNLERKLKEARMTLRDQFAMAAMQGAFTSPIACSNDEKQYISMHSYKMADAMIKARKK